MRRRKAKRRSPARGKSRSRAQAKARRASGRRAAARKTAPRKAAPRRARKAPARVAAARPARARQAVASAGGRIDFSRLSLKDALDLAILIEEEAQERYQEFTRLVGGRYEGDAGDVFRRMAGYEARHRDELVGRRRQLFGDAPRTVTRDMLDDVEAPDRGKPRVFMGPREALEVALASERKAHDFFDGALAFVKDEDVRKLFEELRGEEVTHQQLVKEAMKGVPAGPDVEEEFADEPGSDAGG